MEVEIIAIYCWTEFIVNRMNIEDNCRTIMTVAGSKTSKKTGDILKFINTTQEYGVDSFPVVMCVSCCIFHSKIYHEDKYSGYQASKKKIFL